MSRLSVAAMAACIALIFGSAVHAQQPAPASPPPAPPPDYGLPVTQEQAMKVAAAAQEGAKKLGQRVVITIVGPSGDLLYFTKMDGAQYGSIAISQTKARAAATFRRPTKVFEELLAKGGPTLTLLTLPGVIASAGGIPIMINGKVAGAVGVSGSPTGTIDHEAAEAGLAALK
ncbi:MAG TPA: heme-binding protein [Pseudolabrys sp.]